MYWIHVKSELMIHITDNHISVKYNFKKVSLTNQTRDAIHMLVHS